MEKNNITLRGLDENTFTSLGDSMQPIFTKEYEKKDSYYGPYVPVKVGKNRVKINAYADTGSDVILLPYHVVEEKGIDLGRPASLREPLGITADGRTVYGFLYVDVPVELGGQKFTVEVVVSIEEIEEETEPLLGRIILDKFKVCFNGKEKLLEFFDSASFKV